MTSTEGTTSADANGARWRPEWAGAWAGGRIRVGKHGPIYVIERSVQGKRVAIPLHVGEGEAIKELAKFESATLEFALVLPTSGPGISSRCGLASQQPPRFRAAKPNAPET